MSDLAIETIRTLLEHVAPDLPAAKFGHMLVQTHDATPQPGWLLLPEGGQCPRDLLLVTEADGVHAVASPLSGGFPIRMGLQQLVNDFQIMTGEMIEQATQWHAAWFSTEEYPRFRGYTHGLRWNGWAMPFFELQEAERVAKHFAPLGDQREDHLLTVAQGGQAVTLYPHHPMQTLCPAQRIETDDGRARVVYPIGARTWFWREFATKL